MTLDKLLRRVVTENHGFLRDSDVAELATLDRLRQLLVRTNRGRFVCAAQDVAHYVAAIEATETDYVRDVSLPSTDLAHRGRYDYEAVTTASGFPSH